MIKEGDVLNELFCITGKMCKDVFIGENFLTKERFYISKVKTDESKKTLAVIQNIRNPLLPEIYEIFNYEGVDYYRSELTEGQPLSKIIQKAGSDLSCEVLCRYIAQVSRIVELLHSQFKNPVLHLEISTDTIIISDKNSVHLLNYGYSGSNGISDCEESFSLPETIKNEKCTINSDIYLIGKTLQSILMDECNKITFNKRTGEYMRGIPENIGKIINKCIMSNPDLRYCSAAGLEADLLNVCDTFLKNGVFPDTANPSVLLQDTARKYASDIGDEINNETNADSCKNINADSNTYKSHIKRKSKVICVWDNAVFAAEIACVIADKDKKVLLIDADLLSPKIDLLIEFKNIKKKIDKIESINCLSDLMEEFSGQRLTPDIIKENSLKTIRENLNTICGNYRTEDYEYYNTRGYAEIITKSSEIFDYIIISCNKFIYDEFTCVSLIKSEIIFVPIIANNIFFREFNKYIHFMSGRKQLQNKSIQFAGFDYSSSEDFSLGICEEMCDGKFAGVISSSSRRRMSLGSEKFYTSMIENKIEKQYLGLLKSSGIKL